VETIVTGSASIGPMGFPLGSIIVSRAEHGVPLGLGIKRAGYPAIE
jgi:hypothetical protein